jgi:hypothetical protein
MTNDTLLLRLRAETLHANLLRLRSHLATPDRMKDLCKLADTTEEARTSIGTADKAHLALRDTLDRGKQISWLEPLHPGRDNRTVENAFDEMHEGLDQARRLLLSLQGAIAQMKIKCFCVTETTVGKEIVEGLRSKSGPLITALEIIQTVHNDPKNLKTGWKTLGGKATETKPIFADYMELLGAAALRDTGFDEKISDVADELLRSTEGKLLALPMRRETLVTTLKQIVRVTFPDWTLWALPSTALEFWNVAGLQRVRGALNANLQNLPAEERALVKTEHKQALGDAYATYTMGPAYAYYAVGLVLALNSEQDQRRIRAILTMLEQMEDSMLTSRYNDVRSQLLSAWNAARTQWGQPPLKWGSGFSAEVDAEEKGMRVLIRSFWKTLESETSAKFGIAIWNESLLWVLPLLEDKADKINVPNGVEWRHLLNAAWLARVHTNRNPQRDLNEQIRKLQEMINKRQSKKGM